MAVDVEELRFAVTMNGGVSLAVYIGGVAQELNLISKARPFPEPGSRPRSSKHSTSNPYTGLLQFLRYTEPYIDVLTGTSAGGINAAALALAQTNVNGDIAILKPLWLKHAQFEDLLRPPFQKGAPSLLKGDDYFLPLLEKAFKDMTLGYTRSDRDVDLTMTTTLLTPVVDDPRDEFATTIVERSYAGQFRFRGESRDRAGTDRGYVAPVADSFDSAHVEGTAKALALASRASAGFPVAFEPTFMPVDDRTGHGRTDMGPFVEWRIDPETPASRFGVDGGVLNNTPILPALRGIQERRARNRFVRRVLILVHPHAEDVAALKDQPDQFDEPPSLVGALGSILKAATSTGSHAYVRNIEEHNLSAIRRRDSRTLAVETLPTWIGLLEFLETAAWELFRAMRKERNAVFMAAAVHQPARGSMPVLKARALLYLNTIDAAWGGLPYIPENPPIHRDPQEGGWPWGVALATGITAYIVQMLRDLGKQCVLLPEKADVRRQIVETFSEVANLNIEIDRLGMELEEAARAATKSHTIDHEAQFAAYFAKYDEELSAGVDGRNTIGDKVKSAVDRSVDLFYTGVLEPYWKAKSPAGLATADTLLRGCKNPAEVLTRLLSIEVVAYIVRENSVSGTTDDYVELIQLSARTPQDFDQNSVAGEKLAGMELARFSAFFKESWRANDWIWGRLDAAKTLMQVLLTAEGVKRVCGPTVPVAASDAECDALIGKIAGHAFPDDSYQDMKDLLPEDLLPDAREELRAVLADTRTGQLVALPSLAAYGIQIAIMAEEVQDLRRAIKADDRRGALGNRAAGFVADLDQLAATPEPTAARQAYQQLKAFQRAKIGSETMAEELPSDALIRTISNTVATTATVLTSPRSGLKLATPLTKGIRGVVAVPYWLINGLTQRGQLARIAAASALALGASLVAISLLVSLKGFLAGLVPVLGFGSLFAVAIYGAMRTRSLVHVAALMGLFIPLLMLGLNRAAEQAEKAKTADTADAPSGLDVPAMGWFAVGCTAVIVIGTVAIANLSTPMSSPLSAIANLRRRHPWLTINGLRFVGFAVIAWWFWEAHNRAQWERLKVSIIEPIHHTLADTPPGGPFSLPVYAGIVLAGFLVSLVLSWSFREELPTTTAGQESRRRLIHPTGLAIAWTSVYGALYVLLTWLLVEALEGRSGIDVLPVWVSLGLGVTFSLLVAPVLWVRWKFTSGRRTADRPR